MQKDEERLTPIPRDHFAKMVGGSWEWIRKLINKKKLPALELIQDEETLESVLIPYTSRNAKAYTLFIDPDIASFYQNVLKTLARGPYGAYGPRTTDEEWEAAVKEGALVPYDPTQQHKRNVTDKHRYSPYTTRQIEEAKQNLPQEQSNVFAPVPLSHLARRAEMSEQAVFDAIVHGKIQAVEFMFDEDALESKLRPYVARPTPMQGTPIYVMPEEAQRFVTAVRKNRAEIQAARTKKPTYENHSHHIKNVQPLVRVSEGKLVPFNERERNIPISEELENRVLEAARHLKEQSPNGEVERIKILEVLSNDKRNNMYLYKKIKYIMDKPENLEEFPPHHSGRHAFLHKGGKD